MPSRAVITAPPARPPRYSLITVAESLTLVDRVLLDGYQFDPEVCGSNRGGVLEIECGENQTAPMEAPEMPAIVEGDPFLIYTADECSTMGFAARDWDGRATRMMNAVQSYWLARELATGSLGLAQHSLNDAASTEVTTGAVALAQALAAIEEGMAAAGRGERGMIHVTNGTLVLMAAESLIRMDGTVWVTATGNVVVADAGYTGSAPTEDEAPVDGTLWIYGTSMIGVQLGALNIVPGSFEDARARAAMIDRAINVVTLYVGRPAIWVWDECVHVAAQFDPALSQPSSEVTINGNVEVANDAGAALPISAAALPLPAGAATEATLAALLAASTPALTHQDFTVTTTSEVAESYWGLTVENTHASNASRVEISIDGGGRLDIIRLAAGESVTHWFSPPIPVGGDELDITVSGTGAVVGTLHYAET